MRSIEELITQIKSLTPEQVDKVARIVQGLSRTESAMEPRPPVIPGSLLDEAIRHGWPAPLFTQLIGGLPDLDRAAQPPLQDRADL